MRFPGCVSLGQVDPGHAIVADHPGPQRIVEIEHQHLAAFAPDRRDQAAQRVGVKRNQVIGERLFCHVPRDRIVPRAKTDTRSQRSDIEQVQGAVSAPKSERLVESCDLVEIGTGKHRIETAEQGVCRGRDGLYDQSRTMRPQSTRHRVQLGERTIDCCLGVVRITGRAADCVTVMIEREQYRVTSRSIDCRISVKRGLHRLAERPGHAFDRQTVTQARADNRRNNEIDGRIGDQAEPEGRQSGQRLTVVASLV